jgi:transposase
MSGGAIGVDQGLNDFGVTSDGERIPNLRNIHRLERELVREQRIIFYYISRENG